MYSLVVNVDQSKLRIWPAFFSENFVVRIHININLEQFLGAQKDRLIKRTISMRWPFCAHRTCVFIYKVSIFKRTLISFYVICVYGLN